MRTTLFVLALLGATAGRGQIFLDWYSSAAPAAGLLLDDYPNAAAAYGLRLLRAGYTGNCIEVRRSNDNALQNIGFAGGVIDTAALKTFCGANNCFVRTWYDQSLNARNATQTTDANQPLIVASGVVNRFNGRVAIFIEDASGASQTQRLETPLWHANTDTHVWAFSVSAVPVSGSLAFSQLMNSSPNDRGFILAYGSGSSYSPFRTFTNRSTISGPAQFTVTQGVTYLRVDNANRTNINIWVNNSAGTSSADSNTNFTMPTAYWIGNANNNAVTSRNHITELILYNSDQSTNRTGIQSNINSFYTIY